MFIIELVAVIFFIGTFWLAAHSQGRDWAQQWFIAAVMFVVIRETIVQVVLQTYIFQTGILRLGIVPAVMLLLYPSVLYLAYDVARRLFTRPAWVAFAMFIVAALIGLGIEVLAAQAEWWVYTTSARVLLRGVPLSAPLTWGGAATIFYAVFYRVNQARLPERGKVYALVTLAPAIAAAHLLWMVIVGILG